jgi:hypothetical protein
MQAHRLMHKEGQQGLRSCVKTEECKESNKEPRDARRATPRDPRYPMAATDGWRAQRYKCKVTSGPAKKLGGMVGGRICRTTPFTVYFLLYPAATGGPRGEPNKPRVIRWAFAVACVGLRLCGLAPVWACAVVQAKAPARGQMCGMPGGGAAGPCRRAQFEFGNLHCPAKKLQSCYNPVPTEAGAVRARRSPFAAPSPPPSTSSPTFHSPTFHLTYNLI